MSEIQAITLPKHVNLKAVIEDGQGTITFISKRGNEHPCLHIMELAEGREFLTQCLVALNVANSPEPSKPKKEKGSVQVKLVGTLPKPDPADMAFEEKCKEVDVEVGFYIRDVPGGLDRQWLVQSIRPCQMHGRVQLTVKGPNGDYQEILPTWQGLAEMRRAQLAPHDSQAGDTILTAVLRNCQHSWHIDDARDTPTCPGCDAEA